MKVKVKMDISDNRNDRFIAFTHSNQFVRNSTLPASRLHSGLFYSLRSLHTPNIPDVRWRIRLEYVSDRSSFFSSRKISGILSPSIFQPTEDFSNFASSGREGTVNGRYDNTVRERSPFSTECPSSFRRAL